MNNLFQSLNQWFYFRSIWSVIIIRRIWKRLFSEFFRYWRILGDYCQDLLQKIEEFFSIDYMDSDWRTLKSKWSSNFITYFHFVDKESSNCQTVATSDHDVGDGCWRQNVLVTSSLTTLGCWWRFSPFWSPASAIYKRGAPTFKNITNIEIPSPTSKNCHILKSPT